MDQGDGAIAEFSGIGRYAARQCPTPSSGLTGLELPARAILSHAKAAWQRAQLKGRAPDPGSLSLRLEELPGVPAAVLAAGPALHRLRSIRKLRARTKPPAVPHRPIGHRRERFASIAAGSEARWRASLPSRGHHPGDGPCGPGTPAPRWPATSATAWRVPVPSRHNGNGRKPLSRSSRPSLRNLARPA